MTLSPCVSLKFDGRCEAAFRFYERCFSGSITMLMTWGDSPMGATAPPDWRGKILHASMTVGDGRLVGADVLPGGYEPPRGFSLLLGMTNLAEAESVFTALAEQGTVSLPLQQTFWAARYGIVVDQFGVTWEINCSGEEPHRGPTLDRHR